MRFEMRLLAEVIEPPPRTKPVCRDSHDDWVLAFAVAAKPGQTASGDNVPLSLVSFVGMQPIAPEEALQRIQSPSNVRWATSSSHDGGTPTLSRPPPASGPG
ncbi:MAG: hypothetical protein LW876_13990 [Betaproteobacteria bacterium]|nr:hypothetical protein [Betaproteobacteria bacterium]